MYLLVLRYIPGSRSPSLMYLYTAQYDVEENMKIKIKVVPTI